MPNQQFIYTADPGLILGFHGCDQSVRDAVLTHQDMLKKSENIHDWLGSGYYFWQNNYERAMDFARNPPGKKKYKKPSVLGAVISLGNCLDLSDAKYINIVQMSFNNLKTSLEKTDQPFPKNKNVPHSKDKVLRELDCAVIENIHKLVDQIKDTPFDSVRGIFTEGNLLYDGAGFYEKTHVQICVRNPNCIKGFFLPRNEVKWP